MRSLRLLGVALLLGQSACAFDAGAEAGSALIDAASPIAIADSAAVPNDVGPPSNADASPPPTFSAACGSKETYQANPATGLIYRLGGSQWWSSAATSCELEGAHLVRIDDPSENEFIASLSNDSMWIGANDRGPSNEGNFTWQNGSPLTYDNWGPEQPDDGSSSEDCANINGVTQLWNDEQCTTSLPFVCECPPD